MGDYNSEENRIFVKTFGEFSVSDSEHEIGSKNRISKRLVKILIYFVTNHNKMISIQELSDSIYGADEEVEDPVSAVRNLMWRLRSALKKQWGPAGEDFIITKGRDYSWNPNCEIVLDAEQFEKLCKQGDRADSSEQKIDFYTKAMEYYTGPYMMGYLDILWIAYRSTYYHTMYLTIVKRLAGLLMEAGQYKNMEIITSAALEKEQLDEELYGWFIRSLILQDNYTQALREYGKACNVLYENLGVKQLTFLQQVHEELMKQVHSQEGNISSIVEDLREDMSGGAFFCEYGVFRQIFQLEVRRGERLGISVYLSLISVGVEVTDPNLDDDETKNLVASGMKKLQGVILKSLRSGDVVSRYSGTQFLILLPTCQYETATKVMKRIETAFYKAIKTNKLRMKYNMDEMI